MQTTVIWLSLFVLFLVIEIITMGLTTIWFAGGALVAFLVAVLGLGLGVQIIIFAIVSLALLAVTRPLAMKYFNQERQKTGAELLIGQKALVIEEIDTLSSKGRVEVRGQEWAAKTDAPEGKIPKNAIVVVEGIQGVKLIVGMERRRRYDGSSNGNIFSDYFNYCYGITDFLCEDRKTGAGTCD